MVKQVILATSSLKVRWGLHQGRSSVVSKPPLLGENMGRATAKTNQLLLTLLIPRSLYSAAIAVSLGPNSSRRKLLARYNNIVLANSSAMVCVL